ncbi:MAG: hypothetical protein QNJ44_08585 [Rhodobacter sp.]|nr:hypothetical protein [Rhodobacter sp.]
MANTILSLIVRKNRGFGFSLSLSLACAAALPAPAGDFLYVPIRWCGVEGAASMADPGVVGETTTDNVLWRRHERPSDQVYIPQVDMTFRSAATAAIKNGPYSFPIIRDVEGTGGDLINDENRDSVNMCARVWDMGDPLYYDANLNGFANDGTDSLLSTDFAVAGEVDLGHDGAPLRPAPSDVMYVDSSGDGNFQIGERIYRDENLDASVDAGDTQLVNVLETIVGHVEAADLGATLLTVPPQIRFLDLIHEPVNTFNIGYPRLYGLMAINANDMHFTDYGFPIHGVGYSDGIVVDDASQYLPPGPDFTFFETNLIAHEAGHAFGLRHGDGVDDDGDGIIDNPDDPAAPFPGALEGTLCDTSNVMQYCWVDNGTPGNPDMVFIGTSTPPGVGSFTTAQRNIMRGTILAGIPDFLIDPVVPPLVSVRSDTLGEVAAPLQHLDIARVEVRVDNARATATLQVQTRRAFPRRWRDPSTFIFIVDEDSDPGSGASVELLTEQGIDTEFGGAELVGVVRLRGRAVIGVTVLRYDADAQSLVPVTDQRIRAVVERIEVTPDFPSSQIADPDFTPGRIRPIPSHEEIRLILPIEVLRLTEASRIRAEFITQGPEGEILDRARPSRLDFVKPVFPECQVAPASAPQGGSVTVLASGLLPDRELHLLLGPDEVATGRSDGDGRATLTLPIPEDARTGNRLVTVGALAVTADCIVTVTEAPDDGDGGVPPGAKLLYSAQFLCGPADEALQPGVARGTYETLVTLTNATARPIQFGKRVSRALPRQDAGFVSPLVPGRIAPQSSISVECNEIRHMMPVPMTEQFRSGSLLIFADGRLTVTAVYSARAADGGITSMQTIPIVPQPVK